MLWVNLSFKIIILKIIIENKKIAENMKGDILFAYILKTNFTPEE